MKVLSVPSPHLPSPLLCLCVSMTPPTLSQTRHVSRPCSALCLSVGLRSVGMLCLCIFACLSLSVALVLSRCLSSSGSSLLLSAFIFRLSVSPPPLYPSLCSLFLSLSVCLSVCLSVSPCLSVALDKVRSVSQSVSQSVSLSLSLPLSLFLSVSPSSFSVVFLPISRFSLCVFLCLQPACLSNSFPLSRLPLRASLCLQPACLIPSLSPSQVVPSVESSFSGYHSFWADFLCGCVWRHGMFKTISASKGKTSTRACVRACVRACMCVFKCDAPNSLAGWQWITPATCKDAAGLSG